jgi:tRNA threonylcarbamoyladenosine biosynthesis protein TsaB
MRVLAVDTTSAFGSLALVDHGIVLEELPMHSPDGFSQTLFASLSQVLSRHDWKLESVDVFAAASGPGSFTGVRVGLTAVKGLAEATGRPAAAVSNLQALAACGTSTLRAAMADARRGEIYGAVYDANGCVVQPEIVMPFTKWIESLPSEVEEIVSPDFEPFRPNLTREFRIVEQRTLAAAVARIAARSIASDPAALDANYVRRSDAELNWKDAR